MLRRPIEFTRGGTHDASNLCLLCDAHHTAHHAGTLAKPVSKPPASTSSLGGAVLRVDAKSVLVNLGFKPATASAAVDAAITHVGTNVELTELVREALKCCPR